MLSFIHTVNIIQPYLSQLLLEIKIAKHSNLFDDKPAGACHAAIFIPLILWIRCAHIQHWTSENIYARNVTAKIRRTYEIRVVRGPLQIWYADASHNQSFKKLVYRIKNQAVRLGFEEMVILRAYLYACSLAHVGKESFGDHSVAVTIDEKEHRVSASAESVHLCLPTASVSCSHCLSLGSDGGGEQVKDKGGHPVKVYAHCTMAEAPHVHVLGRLECLLCRASSSRQG